MGYYYIKRLPKNSEEGTDPDRIFQEYFLEEFSESDIEKIWISGGGINYKKFDYGFGSDFIDIITEIAYNLYVYFDPTADEEENEEISKKLEDEDNIQEVITDWVYNAFMNKEYDNQFTKREINTIINLAMDFNDESSPLTTIELEAEVVKVVSSIIYKEPFESIQFRLDDIWGVYPSRLHNKVPFIQALIYNLGTEYVFIDDRTFDSKQEYEDYTKTKDYELGYFLEYCIYGGRYISKIKQWAADIIGCSANDIKVI